jgi:acyl-CoA synthetase (AMP-forming)/AMP-acid ligase II
MAKTIPTANLLMGQMMNRPMMISSILQHAAKHHGDTEIVSRRTEGDIHTYTYADCEVRSQKVAQFIEKLGIKPGDRVGTLAWNGYRHLEIYYGVSGSGAVCHTINPRLFPEQIVYIINHADDQIVMFDTTFLPLIEGIKPSCPGVKHWICLSDEALMPKSDKLEMLCYEKLVSAETGSYEWPEFDENAASSLCYTSGTTGNPKGALYSHRSTVLHSYASAMPDALNISAADTIMPVVPMFHVNAWGLPYSSLLAGARIVFPGAKLDGASLFELFETQKITMSAGVPTIWAGLIQHVVSNKLKFSTFKRTVIGGSACPPAMMETLQGMGIDVIHAWGMTELSPLGTVARLKAKDLKKSHAEQQAILQKQGRVIYGIDMKIIDGDGKELPHDGKAFGDLLVKGSWVIDNYFRGENSPLVDGWFPTGDVSTIDSDSNMQITDRSKDVIKSGGEWISSIDIENVASGHPDIAMAACISAFHPKWDERPLLVVVKKPEVTKNNETLKKDILAFFEGKIAKWWLPDDVAFVDQIPLTATGKMQKLKLREQFKDYQLPTT